jgi:protein-tyrosine-phosphatase
VAVAVLLVFVLKNLERSWMLDSGVKRDDWPIEDPKGKPIEKVREIRDDIRERVRSLVEREGWS